MKERVLAWLSLCLFIVFLPISGTKVFAGSVPVANGPVIETQPENVFYVANTTPVVSVTATGEGLTYQWQYKFPNQQNWTNWSNATNATLGKNFESGYDGLKIRCVIKDKNGNTVTTNEITATLIKINITKQPEDLTFAADTTPVVSVTATGEGLTYQWQYKFPNQQSWSNWSNATNATLGKNFESGYDGLKIRCVIKDKNGATATTREITATLETRFTVTFDAGQGTFGDEIGSTLTNREEPGAYYVEAHWADGEEAIPYRDGYVFVGWLSSDGTQPNWIRLDSNVTFTAMWKSAFTVTYHATTYNGGDSIGEAGFNLKTCQEFGYDHEVNLLVESLEAGDGKYFLPNYPLPEWEGHEFIGWTDYEGNFINYVTGNAGSNIDVYAAYEDVIKVTYDAGDGHWLFDEEEGEFNTVDAYYAPGVFIPGWHEPEREGYRFGGWLLNGKPVRKINLTAPITLTACWVPQTEVIYDTNGGEWERIEHTETHTWYEHLTEISKYGDTGSDYWVYFWQNPTREGYEFLGWSLYSDSARGENFNIRLVDGPIRVYAIWGKNCTVTLDDNNDAGMLIHEDGKYVDTYNLEYNLREGINLGVNLEYNEDEWRFLGWDENPDATEPEYNMNDHVWVTDDTTFYAIWQKRAKITYNGNGGVWYTDEWDEQLNDYVSVDEQYDYRDAGSKFMAGHEKNPRREGYEFRGWLEEDGTSTDNRVYLADPDVELTFYAKWSRRIDVVYDANGGLFDDRGEKLKSHTQYKVWTNELYNLDMWEPYNDFEGGSTFVGWTLDPEADDQTLISFEPGEEIVIPDESDYINEDEGTITFYAVWDPGRHVTYDPNGGGWFKWNDDIQDDEWSTYAEIHRYDLDPNNEYDIGCDWPIREGYEFVGWSTDPEADPFEDEVLEYYNDVVLTKDTIYYAIWTEMAELTFVAGDNGFFDGDRNKHQIKVYWRIGDTIDFDQDFAPFDESHDNIIPENDYGREFSHWTYGNANRQYTFRRMRVTSGMTFYANYSSIVPIEFDLNAEDAVLNGERASAEGTVVRFDVKDGENVRTFNYEPNRPGYEFVGWKNGNDDFINRFTATARFDDNGRVIPYHFTAQWRESDETFDVTFDANGGRFANGNSELTLGLSGQYDIGWNVEKPVRHGFEFVGWVLEGADKTEENTLWSDYMDSDRTYTAVWEDDPVTYVNIWADDCGPNVQAGTEIRIKYEHDGDVDPETAYLWQKQVDDGDWNEVDTSKSDYSEDVSAEDAGHTLYYRLKVYDVISEEWVVSEPISFAVTDSQHGHEQWGVTEVQIFPAEGYGTTVNVDGLISLYHSASGVGTNFEWWKSTDQNHWDKVKYGTSADAGVYWYEEVASTPGTYYYMLIIDKVASNVLEITVEDENQQGEDWDVTIYVPEGYSTTVKVGQKIRIECSENGTEYVWWKYYEDGHATIGGEDDYYEETAETPGTYQYRVFVDDVPSNGLKFTVVE